MPLEHVNITVSDPDHMAGLLGDLFGWRVRWDGPAAGAGRSVHVGDADSYVALYRPAEGSTAGASDTYHTAGSLNHIGVVVDDLDAVEARVREAGYKPHNHADYEPGRRFYFDAEDGIEIEVVAYD